MSTRFPHGCLDPVLRSPLGHDLDASVRTLSAHALILQPFGAAAERTSNDVRSAAIGWPSTPQTDRRATVVAAATCVQITRAQVRVPGRERRTSRRRNDAPGLACLVIEHRLALPSG